MANPTGHTKHLATVEVPATRCNLDDLYQALVDGLDGAMIDGYDVDTRTIRPDLPSRVCQMDTPDGPVCDRTYDQRPCGTCPDQEDPNQTALVRHVVEEAQTVVAAAADQPGGVPAELRALAAAVNRYEAATEGDTQ